MTAEDNKMKNMILLIMIVVEIMPRIMIMIAVVILLQLYSCQNQKKLYNVFFFVKNDRQRMSIKEKNLMSDMNVSILLCYYTLMMADFIKDGSVSSNLQQKWKIETTLSV